ncbi:MAG: hypothetical protein KJ000_26310, partial [Pirellulaceae bacterium]|nr:hypothetical protein [Pirellulaceae bacterium]
TPHLASWKLTPRLFQQPLERSMFALERTIDLLSSWQSMNAAGTIAYHATTSDAYGFAGTHGSAVPLAQYSIR